MEQDHNRGRLERYLLGKLSEPEQVEVETDYFEDSEKFEEVWAAENDLIVRTPDPYNAEPRLIALAYAFEQATKKRAPPSQFP